MDVIEVERKRRVGNHGATLRAQLTENGWVCSAPVTETDDYYSRPDVDFMATVECLRVRQRDGFSEITYKPPSNATTHSTDGVISKTEVNVRLMGDEASKAQQLLAALGMTHLVRVAKTRTTYRRPGESDLLVTVDEVARIGTFAEVEISGTDAESAAMALKETEVELGLRELPLVSLPYRDLAMEAVATPERAVPPPWPL